MSLDLKGGDRQELIWKKGTPTPMAAARVSIEQKEESKGNEENVKLIKGYRQKVEEELSKIRTGILGIIDKHLILSSTSGEATVFYYKM
ncbi:14-3-3 protein [Corchorus capsularis]|uniref:14-3-3 protein n=1 Tax=Corchorus capsularis TaxID=210143 RepID=A0A1R3I3F8_COCAP|nr:14-3-3 protein [Corchorus capsularis]